MNSSQPGNIKFTYYLIQWVPSPVWSLTLRPEPKQSCFLYFIHNNQKGCTEDDDIAMILLPDDVSFLQSETYKVLLGLCGEGIP